MKRLTDPTTIICFVLIAFVMASCDDSINVAEQANPETYPTITITTDHQGSTVAEGDTIMYSIKIDKPVEQPIDFELVVSGGEASADDYIVNPNKDGKSQSVVYPTFIEDTTIIFPVVFPVDNIPEKAEKITYTIKDATVGTKYGWNPASTFPTQQLTVENFNNPTAITIYLDWMNGSKHVAMWGINFQDGAWSGYYFKADAKPATILAGLPGVSFFSLNADSTTRVDFKELNYKFSIGYPDQTVEFIEGTYTFSDSSRIDPILDILASPDFYPDTFEPGNQRFLRVVAVPTGNKQMPLSFTVKNLDEEPQSSAQAAYQKEFNLLPLERINRSRLRRAGLLFENNNR